jgi:hypothetical protein
MRSTAHRCYHTAYARGFCGSPSHCRRWSGTLALRDQTRIDLVCVCLFALIWSGESSSAVPRRNRSMHVCYCPELPSHGECLQRIWPACSLSLLPVNVLAVSSCRATSCSSQRCIMHLNCCCPDWFANPADEMSASGMLSDTRFDTTKRNNRVFALQACRPNSTCNLLGASVAYQFTVLRVVCTGVRSFESSFLNRDRTSNVSC